MSSRNFFRWVEKGRQKSSKSFRTTLDPLAIEIIDIEDRISIELNVATAGQPHFKDAAELSQGQKCTALLPLLLSRRDMPLLIDQPEDNLDNHFIYETVVDAVRRLRDVRQMIFITHNANIPVLGEADLVVVMNSDGKKGYVRKGRKSRRLPRRNHRSARRAAKKRSRRARDDMPSRDSALAAFEELRRLAAESPARCAGEVGRVARLGDAVLEETLRLASAPGEGRLRQLIANAVKNRPDKARVVPHLVRWLELETDEFAKAAIGGALIDVERATYQPAAAPDPPRLVDTYRYVADRLCHRVRNSLTGPVATPSEARIVIRRHGGPDRHRGKSRSEPTERRAPRLSRIVEFDIEDSYFQWRSVDLPAWIRTMTAK